MKVIGCGTIIIKIWFDLKLEFQLESIHNRTNIYEADIISTSLAST